MNAIDSKLLDTFCDTLWVEAGLSKSTLMSYRSDLGQLSLWLGGRGKLLTEVAASDLRDYLLDFSNRTKFASQRRLIVSLRRFYRHLLATGVINADPTVGVELPPRTERFPKTLSKTEVEALLEAPDVAMPLGLRDRTMLEVLYATGLRVSELVELGMADIRLGEGVARIAGRGGKERLVPLGEVALKWLKRYFKEARPVLMAGRVCETLFVTHRGAGLTRQTFWHLVKRYARCADIDPAHLSPHTLRHAFASHLISNGAALRVMQLLLGHADISTTRIYTHVAEERFKEMNTTDCSLD